MSAPLLQFKNALKVSAATLILASFGFAQQISVSPGIITSIASRTNETFVAAGFNGVAARTGTLYVSDSHVARFVNGAPIYVANVYAITLSSGQVTRIAGIAPDAVNGNSGYSGDGGPATSARLNQPAGLAFDAGRNWLYIADSGQNVVRRIDLATNIITTVAGNGNPALNLFSGDGGPATSAQLGFPTGIALNPAGDLFISDTFNARVRMVSLSSGIINTVAGNGTRAHSGDNGPATSASLDRPLGITVDQNNSLYIADSTQTPNGNEVVRKVSSGIMTTVATQLANPYGVVADQGGAVYISDSGHFKILRLSADGQISTVAGNGSPGFTGDGGPALSATLSGPGDINISPEGDLYFVDSGQPAVRRITGLPAPAVFPLTAPGSSSSTTITISATGNQPLNVSQINPPANFTVTGGSCGGAPFTLNAGRSCTLVLSLTPPVAGGATSGTLTIVSNAVNSGTTPVLLSMSNGLYFVPLQQPCRVVDTRWPNGTYGGPLLAANQTRNFALRNSSNTNPASYPGACPSLPIPSNADVQAYSLNVTVVPRGTLQWLTVWPTSPGDPPFVSTLNSSDGRTKANAVIVPADTRDNNRSISVFAKDNTDLIIDINGYYVPESTPSSLAFYPLAPCRAVDTRDGGRGSGLGSPSMGNNETRIFSLQASGCNLPSSAQAYAVNFTAVPKGNRLAYLTVWPSGQGQPIVSTLNATTGAVTANAAIVPAGAGGAISAYTTDATDLIVDVSGYYAPRGSGGLALYNVTPPCRAFDSRGTDGRGAPINGLFSVNVAGGGCGNVSGTAQSAVLNATVVPAASLSYLTLWAQGPIPLQSTLNAYDLATTSNLAVVPTVGGFVTSFTTAPTALIIDVFGYFAP